MKIVSIGLNHKTATIELREKLAFSGSKLGQAYTSLLKYPLIKESFIVSTCNRVEMYCLVDDEMSNTAYLKKFLSSFHKIEAEDFQDKLYCYFDSQAVYHLFEVACGLDSLVVGEMQILRQLKEAYFLAQKYKATGKFLNVLLQKSFHTAKQVRSQTGIGRGRLSISSIAVTMAEQALGGLSEKTILVVGAGKVSETTVRYLASQGVGSIIVSNRRFCRAEKLSDTFPEKVRAVKFDALLDYIASADIVISSTSAPSFVITYDDINRIARNRKNKPLFFIDLAVPRDIEPNVSRISGIHHYDIDDLEKIVENNTQLRRQEIQMCKQIIERQVMRFTEWFKWEKIDASFTEVAGESESIAVC